MARARRFYSSGRDCSTAFLVVDRRDGAGHVRRDDGTIGLDDDQRLGRYSPPAAVDDVGHHDGGNDGALGVADAVDVCEVVAAERDPRAFLTFTCSWPATYRYGRCTVSGQPLSNACLPGAAAVADDGDDDPDRQRHVPHHRGRLSVDSVQAPLSSRPAGLRFRFCRHWRPGGMGALRMGITMGSIASDVAGR